MFFLELSSNKKMQIFCSSKDSAFREVLFEDTFGNTCPL